MTGYLEDHNLLLQLEEISVIFKVNILNSEMRKESQHKNVIYLARSQAATYIKYPLTHYFKFRFIVYTIYHPIAENKHIYYRLGYTIKHLRSLLRDSKIQRIEGKSRIVEYSPKYTSHISFS